MLIQMKIGMELHNKNLDLVECFLEKSERETLKKESNKQEKIL